MRRSLILTCLSGLSLLGCGGGGENESASEGSGIGLTTLAETTTTAGDGDGDEDSDTDNLPKFDLPELPDAGGGIGGEFGIPEDCNTADQVESAVGCQFFSLDLDNLSSGETQPYGVIVSNVQEETVAEAFVEEKQNGNWVTIAGPQQIQPLDSYVFQLPDNHSEGSALTVGGAYRITTDVPTVAYAFNPIDGQASFTSDASLLFPVASWDYIYEVVGYKVTIGYGSYINVIASVDGTEVEVTPSGATVAGGGVPAGQPNQPFVIQLDEGDVAQIATPDTANATMTGTKVESDESHPIGVMTGTECTNTGQGACDHMEEMLTGVRLWGLEFVASRMPIRQVNNPEQTFWMIYASEDGTTVNIDADPTVTGLPNGPVMLNKGDFVEYQVTGPVDNPGDFFVSADKPIAVMSFLIGISGGDGDPAMMQMSPVEQYLPRYVLLVPGTWVNDYLVITRPAGAMVELDGVVIGDNEFIPVGNGDYEVARLLTPDGVHSVDGLGAPVSASVVGFDSYDSYAYLGGVGTSVINPAPQG